MKDTNIKQIQGLVWHEGRVKEDEYGGSIMYSCIAMEQ
jgi:methionine salvage enolase-phosphatase E1